MKFVAVTSCPTGIAHTYMAAEALEVAAQEAGHEILVETQGAAGAVPITPEQVAEADAVIFANDVDVRDRDRFLGKPLVQSGVKRAINDGSSMIAEAERAAMAAMAAAPAGPGGPVPPVVATQAPEEPRGQGIGTRLRVWLMTGVSYMIPFVAAGGILIAIAFLIGGGEVVPKVNGGEWQGVTYPGVTDFSQLLDQAGWAGVFFWIGGKAFSMLVPILSGFIAYAMVDRLGLVPGIVAGLVATSVGAGFLGGLAGGLLAGAVVMLLTRWKAPRAFAGIMPVVVIPVISTIIVGSLMLIVLGPPIADVTEWLTDWLNGLTGTNAVVLGALLGAMMAVDMGGPINKVAYAFGLASLTSENFTVMAAVMAAGMVPPVAMAMATVVRPRLFSRSERQAGEAAWLLGASFITEGAIPFAAADPIRVIPSLVLGSSVTGALSMAFDCTSRAPHGGIWVIGLIGNPIMWFLSIVVGAIVGCAAVVALKYQGGRAAAIQAAEASGGSHDPVVALA